MPARVRENDGCCGLLSVLRLVAPRRKVRGCFHFFSVDALDALILVGPVLWQRLDSTLMSRVNG